VERLWAIGRMKYIDEMKARKRAGVEENEETCFFCAGLRGADGPDNLILIREPRAMVMLNLYPYNPGHLMIAPRRHVASPRELDPGESAAVMDLLGRSEGLLARAFEPEGFNVGMNLGRCAGAGVPGHLHLHLIPRWTGDTNFMPLTAGAKVMVESVAETYARLAGLIADGGADGGEARGV
jgi:ATP adenylyltransferase